MTQSVTPPDGLRLYYLNPLSAGPLAGWGNHFRQAAALGFSHVLISPPFCPARHGSLLLSATLDTLLPELGYSGAADSGLAAIAQMAKEAGVSLLLDLVPERVANGSPLAQAPGSPFRHPDTGLDPRRFDPDGDAAYAALDPGGLAELATFWRVHLCRWAALGIAGVRLTGLHHLSPDFVGAIAGCGLALYGWLIGVPIVDLPAFEGCGLDYVFSSFPWWDGQADWFWLEEAALRRIAPVIHAAEAPFAGRRGAQEPDRETRRCIQRQALTLAAFLGPGWMMVMGQERGAMRRLDAIRGATDDPDTPDDFRHLVVELNRARIATPPLSASAVRPLSGAGAPILVVERAAADPRLPGDAAVVAVNLGRAEAAFRPAAYYANLGGYYELSLLDHPISLQAGGYLIQTLSWRSPDHRRHVSLAPAARAAAKAPRIAIENVTPTVDGGRFPVRACVGETVCVEADLICDGHDVLAAELRWQAPDQTDWQRAPMRPLGNDRWTADLPVTRMGFYRFTVEAWKDVFATYRDELGKKVAAGLDVALEVEEGRLLIVAAAAHAAEPTAGLTQLVATIAGTTPAERIALLLADDTAARMRAADSRAFATWIDPAFPLQAERTAARFASWYELFPRSMSDDATRHGHFTDVIAHLPRIAAMGFDVLYFPPVHPIGQTNRKGRNNALVAAPDDPGSPYGIADHTAIHPELGTMAEFHALRDAALAHGLELALDFAIQCSPDHRWLKEHKGWFDWRPDGSIRYAENPPKKYQDIVNVDFYQPDAIEGLWEALCEVVLFWCAQGVRIFRVDNPHTKPLPFWHWMIGTVQDQHPDVVFLAEAFTKPKMMNRLAKVGFSQSYTYFTWRDTRAEFQEYLTELTTTAAKNFFRPNFFVNTPDINPVFLQNNGRPGHLIRAALAATLSGLWGMYCGFELCEATPVPGREEYLDSEKYQLRAWDWDRPGNIVREIAQLNGMRRLNPALQTHLGLTFLDAGNENILVFEKATPDRANVLVVAINLDPDAAQETTFEIPLWRWKLPDWASVEVDDLVFETRFAWTGKMQHVRLDPQSNPYAVWRTRPA